MNLAGRQSTNIEDLRGQSLPQLSEEARVIQFVRHEGTPMQVAQVVTYVAIRGHKAEIGLFAAFVVFFVWALRDLCRLSRMLRRRLARQCVKCGSSPVDESPRSVSCGASMLHPAAFGVAGDFICRPCLDRYRSVKEREAQERTA